MENDRRNSIRRGAIVRYVLNRILENPSIMLSVDTLQQWLQLPGDVAERILRRLIDAGVLREVNRGVWVPSPMAGAPAGRLNDG